MDLPKNVHPKKFLIDGMFFEVISYSKLTDEQAANIAMRFYRSRKFKKSDKNRLFKVVTVL